jgi:muramoyltetrapeptide carboxypeptidase LdcA involved in peptidoglycan recycling
MKAGISSFYGAAILPDFAENVKMPDYTIEWINKTLFSNEVIGEIAPAKEWTSEHLAWIVENKNTARKMNQNTGYEVLQGNASVRGKLIGGCISVVELLKPSSLFLDADYFEETILFLETSEEKQPIWYMENCLRSYGLLGILGKINGLIFGKPYDHYLYDEYKSTIKKVLAEFGCINMPVLYNVNFGHTEPKICLPFGALAEINCEKQTFSILESAVV